MEVNGYFREIRRDVNTTIRMEVNV